MFYMINLMGPNSSEREIWPKADGQGIYYFEQFGLSRDTAPSMDYYMRIASKDPNSLFSLLISHFSILCHTRHCFDSHVLSYLILSPSFVTQGQREFFISSKWSTSKKKMHSF